MARELRFDIIARNMVHQGISAATSSIQGLGRSFMGAVGGMATSMMGWTAIIAGVIAGIKSVFSEAAKIKDMSESTGTTIMGFQKLAIIARESGMDVNKLGAQLTRLRDIQDGLATNPAAQKAIRGLGLEVAKVVDSGSVEDLMDMLAEGFVKTGNVAAIFDLFGRGAGYMTETLRALHAAKTDLDSSMSKQFVSEKDVEIIDKAGEKLERLVAIAKAWGARQIVGAVEPTTAASDAMTSGSFLDYIDIGNQLGVIHEYIALKMGPSDEEQQAKADKDFQKWKDNLMAARAKEKAPKKSAIVSDEATAELAGANQKLLDATGTLQERMNNRVELLTKELALLDKGNMLATDRAKTEARIAGIRTEMAGIKKDMDAEAKAAADKTAAEAKAAADLQESAQKDALAAAKALAAEEKNGDSAAARAAAAQLAADTDHLNKLKQYNDTAKTEIMARYEDAQNRAEEAFQGFMDPDRFRATEEAKKQRIASEKDLQNTVKWMGSKPRDWMSDKEKAASDVMSARDEAAAAAVVLGLIETNTRALDVKLDALIKMKG